MSKFMWIVQYVDRVVENGTRPPATIDGCLGDSFWSWMLQDFAVYAEREESDDAPRRALELLTWFNWWDTVADPGAAEAGQLHGAVTTLGQGLASDATAVAALAAAASGDTGTDGLGAHVATLRAELDAGLATIYDEFRDIAAAAETMATNRYGSDGVLPDHEPSMSGVLEVRNPATGEFENELQHREITDADFEQIAEINGANVKALDDRESTNFIISGFFVLIGGGHDYNQWWAEERERTGMETAIRGQVTVRKGGIGGAGKLTFTNVPPLSQSLVTDAVARFSDKDVEFA
ncbi:MAG TPA: hypothetical protein VF855_00370 [Acidimicrobiales bacterium]